MRCRSGSAVKRSQTLAFGSPLGSQHKRRSSSGKSRAAGEGRRSSFGAKPGPSTAKRQKRKALLDILERVGIMHISLHSRALSHPSWGLCLHGTVSPVSCLKHQLHYYVRISGGWDART